MNALMDNREQMRNPTAFIQSTFNTVGAQLALLLKIHAYNVTYVHLSLIHIDEASALRNIPSRRIETEFDTFLSHSFGFGGTNSSLIIRTSILHGRTASSISRISPARLLALGRAL